MKFSKKAILSMSLALVMTAGFLAGCSSSSNTEQTKPAAVAGNTTTKWPERPIELIVPFKAGGDTDFYARTYAKYLEKELGQSIAIINVDGAGGTVGATQVVGAKNDGYKMLFYHTGNMFTNKLLGSTDLDHNSLDIAAIGVIDNTNVLVAGAKTGIKDAKDFLEKAKAAPGKYSVATTISGFSYFTVCKMEDKGKFDLNPVDAGGASAMIPALLGSQVDLAVNSYGVFKQYIDNGDVIPLMTSGKERNPNFPNVPTTTELGMTGSDAERAYFFAFPKGTDPAIQQKLSDAVKAIQSNENYVKDIGNAYYVKPAFIAKENVVKYMEDMWNSMKSYADILTAK